MHHQALCCLLLAALASAQVERVDSDAELRAALPRLGPGHTLRLLPGVYRGGLHVELQGSAEQPIVIEAADAEHPPVLRGGGTGLHVARARYVTLRGLVIEGAQQGGLNLDDGGARDGRARGVRLERLVVRDVQGQGNHDGIKLSGLDDFVVSDCTIERWGRGGSGIDLVGCHDGRIQGCVLRHVPGQGANGIQAKGGSARITIEHCFLEHAGQRAIQLGGSTGKEYFRPPGALYEAQELLVQDCVVVGADAALAFVGVDGAIVRHCLIVRPCRWVLRILQETRDEGFVPCRNGRFEHNVVLWQRRQLRQTCNVGPGTQPESFLFRANWWYCVDAPIESHPALSSKEQDGRYGVDPEVLETSGAPPRLGPDSPARRYGPRPRSSAADTGPGHTKR